MKGKKFVIIISFFLLFISIGLILCNGKCFFVFSDNWQSVLTGLIASSLLSFFIGLIEYQQERDNLFRQFQTAVLKIAIQYKNLEYMITVINDDLLCDYFYKEYWNNEVICVTHEYQKQIINGIWKSNDYIDDVSSTMFYEAVEKDKKIVLDAVDQYLLLYNTISYRELFDAYYDMSFFSYRLKSLIDDRICKPVEEMRRHLNELHFHLLKFKNTLDEKGDGNFASAICFIRQFEDYVFNVDRDGNVMKIYSKFSYEMMSGLYDVLVCYRGNSFKKKEDRPEYRIFLKQVTLV